MLEFFDAVFASFIGSGTWRSSLQNTWQVLLLITALIWGGGPEKIVICIWLAATQLSTYLRKIYYVGATADERWGSLNEASLSVDLVMLVGFVLLALQANRQYLIWIAALQVIATMSHGVRATTDEMSVFVYLLIFTAAGWLQIFIMTAGQIAHARRKRGVYPDWRWQVDRPAASQALN